MRIRTVLAAVAVVGSVALGAGAPPSGATPGPPAPSGERQELPPEVVADLRERAAAARPSAGASTTESAAAASTTEHATAAATAPCRGGLVDDPDEGFFALDVGQIYTSQPCGADYYAIRFTTWDAWDFADFYGAYLGFDTDSNTGTGCMGYDFGGIVDGSDLYRGVIFRTPTCDDSGWTVSGEIYGTRQEATELTLLVNVNAIHNPQQPFVMYGGLESWYDEFADDTADFVVNAAPTTFSNGRCTIPYSESTTNRDVVRLYLAYFLRAPEQDGLNYWVPRYRTGELCLTEISEFFAGSPEFLSRYGTLDDGQYVDLLYQNVLGRSPDAEGRAYWVGRLAAGATRGAIMVGFAESPEFRQRVALE